MLCAIAGTLISGLKKVFQLALRTKIDLERVETFVVVWNVGCRFVCRLSTSLCVTYATCTDDGSKGPESYARWRQGVTRLLFLTIQTARGSEPRKDMGSSRITISMKLSSC